MKKCLVWLLNVRKMANIGRKAFEVDLVDISVMRDMLSDEMGLFGDCPLRNLMPPKDFLCPFRSQGYITNQFTYKTCF